MTTIKYHTKEEALAAVTKNGSELQFCSPRLQNNEEVVMAAIKQGVWAFKYASTELRSSKTFIMAALLNEVRAHSLIKYSLKSVQSDFNVISLAIEKNNSGFVFRYAEGEAALNKELAARAITKWGNTYGSKDFDIWDNLHPTLQEFFPENTFFETAKAYLLQLEQNSKQAKMVTGGCNEEDEVVW